MRKLLAFAFAALVFIGIALAARQDSKPINVMTAKAPVIHSYSPGNTGDIAVGKIGSYWYLFICVDTNKWYRAKLTTTKW